MHRQAPLALGALAACAVLATGGLLLRGDILSFSAWPETRDPRPAPQIAIPGDQSRRPLVAREGLTTAGTGADRTSAPLLGAGPPALPVPPLAGRGAGPPGLGRARGRTDRPVVLAVARRDPDRSAVGQRPAAAGDPRARPAPRARRPPFRCRCRPPRRSPRRS